MIVIKFGGTSVSSKERIKTICEIVKKEQKRNPVVVVSAVRGVTDLLISLIAASSMDRKKILKEIEEIHLDLILGEKNEQEMKTHVRKILEEADGEFNKNVRQKEFSDRIVSYGEILSSFIISEFIKNFGISSKTVISTELIVTNNHFTNAEFLPKQTEAKIKENLLPLIDKEIVPVVTGFIGATEKGEITTLGRGGSDYSAAILGYCLNSEEVQIWTDVDGVFSADPSKIPDARQLERITYKEASELAAFGAKVLHPRTIRPLVSKNIPVLVKNTFNPTSRGTYINGKASGKARIAAVASKPEVTLVNLYSAEMLLSRGFLEKIFSVFAKHNISVDLVSVSEVSVSVTLDNKEELQEAINELRNFATTSTSQVGVVSLIGENILETSGVLKEVFSILSDAKVPVRMLSLGASDINISIVTDPEYVLPAVKKLHNGLLWSESERRLG